MHASSSWPPAPRYTCDMESRENRRGSPTASSSVAEYTLVISRSVSSREASKQCEWRGAVSAFAMRGRWIVKWYQSFASNHVLILGPADWGDFLARADRIIIADCCMELKCAGGYEERPLLATVYDVGLTRRRRENLSPIHRHVGSFCMSTWRMHSDGPVALMSAPPLPFSPLPLTSFH